MIKEITKPLQQILNFNVIILEFVELFGIIPEMIFWILIFN